MPLIATKKTDAEARALATLFFKDAMSEDGPFREPIVDYRLFSNLGAPISEFDVAILLALFSRSAEFSSQDIGFLLRARNWRFHALASGASTLVPPYGAEVSHFLWMRVRIGCAMIAQLSAVAAIRDPEFLANARRLRKLSSTDTQSVAALAALAFWMRHQPELEQSPRSAAKELEKWGAVGHKSIAWYTKLGTLRGAA